MIPTNFFFRARRVRILSTDWHRFQRKAITIKWSIDKNEGLVKENIWKIFGQEQIEKIC
jgi:hypothetical protein